jgi:hypothetical protein
MSRIDWIERFSGELVASLCVAALSGLTAVLLSIRRLQVLRALVIERYEEYSAAHEENEEAEALVRLHSAVEEFGNAALWYPLPSRKTYRTIHRRLELEIQRGGRQIFLLYPIRDLRDGWINPLRGASPDELDAEQQRLAAWERRWHLVIAATAVLLPLLLAAVVALTADGLPR